MGMDIASVIVGATVGFGASYLLERVRRRHAMTDARRKSYATWFTNEELLRQRASRVCEKLVGFPRDEARYAAVTAEVASLADDAKTLAAAMNEAFLAESNSQVRKRLSVMSEFLLKLADTLDFAARHYGENLEFNKTFLEMDEETLSQLSTEQRHEWENMRASFTEHDANCPFKSKEFRLQLAGALDLIHEKAAELRSMLAARLSY